MAAPRSDRGGTRPQSLVDPQAFRDWCRLLYVPGDVFQVQIRDGARVWAAAYHYNDIDDLVASLPSVLGPLNAPAVGLTVNPVRAELLSRGALSDGGTPATAADIRERRWLPVALEGDPVDARELAERMVATLGAEGWAAPVVVEGPSQVVLLFRIRLRSDREDGELVARGLFGLSERFLSAGTKMSRAAVTADWVVGAVGAGAPTKQWRVERAPARLDLLTRDRLLTNRTPEVQTSPSWEQDAFESGLEQLERVFAEVPVRNPGTEFIEFESAPPAAPKPPPQLRRPAAPTRLVDDQPDTLLPAPVVPHRPVALRAVAAALPVTDFDEVLDRYRQQHQERGTRIVTGFEAIDEAVGGLRGLVLLDGQAGEGRSTMAFQVALHTLLSGDGASVAVVIVSLGLRRSDVTDRLVSSVSGLPLDLLHHGRVRQRVHGEDGLRLDAKERRQLKDAKARLQAVQPQLFIVDADWMSRACGNARPRESLAALLAETKESAGARRSLCVLDDFAGLADLCPQTDPVAELQALARAHADDVVLAVVTGGGPEALQRTATRRLALTRASNESRAGYEPMRLSATTRRSGAADAKVGLRFYYDRHRFEVDK